MKRYFGSVPFLSICFGLLAMLSIHVAFAQEAKPAIKPMTLAQKAGLPYVFVGQFESLGAQSALEFAPNLNLGRLGDSSYWVIVRVVQPLKFPEDRPLPDRLILRMYPIWFYKWGHRPRIDMSVMEKLFREHYQRQQFVFFGSRAGFLEGVTNPQTLQMLTSRGYTIHEPLETLPEVQRLIVER